MSLILYNSLTRAKEEFSPLHPPRVGLYTCGPTVYNYQHVGNYRTYIFEDLLVRTLMLFGYKVQRVMNITDVGHLVSQGDEGEDKMEVGAAREGKTAWEIAKFYTDAFLDDCRQLNLVPPDVLCRATDYIKEQIQLIERLQAKGLVYRTSDGLYFDTAKFPEYGRLAGREHIEGLRSGARVEANAEKHSITDFALWKFSPAGKKRQMEWSSPWGVGFPGWHIECSAMAMKFLGESFDIHCGGIDHVPVHHTNEIAQSEGATGHAFARFWLHGEFLLMNNAKMAKSEGGFVTLANLTARGFSPLDYRYHCLTAHYRRQLDFTWDVLESSKTARRRLSDAALAVADAPEEPVPAAFDQSFRAALADDLNAPGALAVLWDMLKSSVSHGAKRAALQTAESVLALGLLTRSEETVPTDVQRLIDRRVAARAARDFTLSDTLRQELDALGILVEDTKQGQKWRRK